MKTTRRTWVTGLSFVFALLIAATPMLIAKGKKKGGENAAPAAAPVETPTNNNTAALTAAQNDLTTATAKLKQVTAKAWADFETTPEWIAAEKAVTDAQTAYDAACKPVMASLTDNPDYKAASDSSTDIDAKIEAAREAGDQDQVVQLAQDKMNGANTVAKMQADALNADPGVAAAKQNLTAAKAAEDQLRQKFQTSLASNSDYTTAKQAVDDAQTKLASLRSSSSSSATANANRTGSGSDTGSGSGSPTNLGGTGDGANSVPDVGSTVEGTTGAP